MPKHNAHGKDISLIENAAVVTPYRIIEHGSVLIQEGMIADIRQGGVRQTTERASRGKLNAKGKIVIPGMIDIHTHGLNGGSALSGGIESIKKMASSFPRHGVTSFLPTTGVEPNEMLLSTTRAVAGLIGSEVVSDEAEVLGMNLEGPYLSRTKLGAQPVDFIRDPSIDEFDLIYDESGRNVKLITIAPEVPGALEFIKRVKAKGVTVAAGHSNATYEEMLAAINAGVTHASHTFNAMRDFKQRDPGILAAVLVRDDVTAELIADNVHVHEGAMRLLIKTKGAEKVVLISDSIPPAGMPDGKYSLMGFSVELKNGVCTLPTGQLAGSTVTLDRSLRVLVTSLGLPLQQAVKMATINPAKVIGVDARKGSIEKGKDADLVILNQEDLSIYATIIKGQLLQH
ncbi:MAG: N-acetylglucosamine-6-phosphate deacetylase [Candidatus Atabeyarchaeum deiterrae]